MPEDTEPPAVPQDETPQSPGYFNKEQLNDIEEAEDVLSAARTEGEVMAEQDIDGAYLDGLEAMITEAHNRTSTAGLQKDQAKTDTAEANAAAKKLFTALQKIQSSAKQKHRMLAEDGDPDTNFPLDGYLIGTRIDASGAVLCQSATSLITRATDDSLPGFKTPDKIQDVQDLLDAYELHEESHMQTTRSKELSRLSRDELIGVLNTRRSAVQHAADAIWPYTDLLTRPIRKTFLIPQTRPLNL